MIENAAPRDEIRRQFQTLIDSKSTTREQLLDCLATWPILLPVWFPRNNQMLRNVPLGADYVADFAYVRADTQGTLWRFIHVANPEIRLLDVDQPSSGLVDAVNHVQRWNDWFEESYENLPHLLPFPKFMVQEFVAFEPEIYLVIGRLAEIRHFQDHPTVENWSFIDRLEFPNVHLTTFDRLLDNVAVGSWHDEPPVTTCDIIEGQSEVSSTMIIE